MSKQFSFFSVLVSLILFGSGFYLLLNYVKSSTFLDLELLQITFQFMIVVLGTLNLSNLNKKWGETLISFFHKIAFI